MEQIKGAAWGSGLFAYVESDLAFDSPQARLTVNRQKAGEMGVSMQDIADTLATLVGENYVNRFNWFDRSYDVITQVPRAQRQAPDDLTGYYVRASSGELVPLATVVDVHTQPEANRLPQFNQMNSATLSAVLMPWERRWTFCRGSHCRRAPASTGCPTAVSSSRKATAWWCRSALP